MGIRKIALALVAAVIAAVAISACGGGDDDSGGDAPGVTSDTIEIGGTNASTGSSAAACLPDVEGSEAWIDKVNGEGGVNGRQIKWKVLDSENNPARGIANVRQLVTQENVFAMFGGCGSGAAAGVIPFLEQEKVPYVVPNALSPALLNKEMATQITPLFNQQLPSVLEYAYEQNGPGDIAIVYIEGIDNLMVSAVKEVAEKAGKKVVADIPVSLETSDFGPVAIKVKDANPDYVLLGTNTPQAGEAVKQLASQGFDPKNYLGTQALADSVYAETAGEAANEITLAGSPVLPVTSPEAKECNETLPSSLKPTFYTLLGCAQAKVLVAALEKAGDDLTREGLVKALQSFKDVETGVTPPLTWNPVGLLIEILSIQKLNGQGEFEEVAQVPLPEPLTEEE